jgi:hypothetical protein
MPFYVELIATDGVSQERILWVTRTPKGVSSGYLSEAPNLGNMHVTYHTNGKYHLRLNGEKHPKELGLRPPLSNLKGTALLFSTGFSTTIKKLYPLPYKLKRLDAMVSIDVRNYERHLGCMVLLVEPNNFDALGKVAKFPPNEVLEVHSFLQCSPWLSIILYGKRKPESPKI